MKEITVKPINEYQMEITVEGKKVVLTDIKKVNAAKAKKRKVINLIINTILVIACAVLIFLGTWLFLTYDEGHYEADHMDENGVLYDIDGDGDYYHWVDPE